MAKDYHTEDYDLDDKPGGMRKGHGVTKGF
jgi:hypothetical protein